MNRFFCQRNLKRILKKDLERNLKKSLVLSATASLCALPTHAYNFIEKTEASGQVKLGSYYVDNKQVESRVFGVTAYLNLKTQILDSLEMDISVGATTEVGSNNSFIVDEYAPRRQWRLKRAVIKWSPFSFFSTKLGAINQKDYYAPLLLTRTAFMGAQEELSLNLTDDHRFFFRMQQAVPNNLNLTQRIGIVETGTPSFFIETVGMELKGNVLAVMAQGGRWSYDSLSVGAAYNSQFIGNSVSGGSRLNSEYLYRFSGYTASGAVRVHFTDDIGVKFYGQFLYNEEAPEERNKGQILKTALIFGHWRPSFEFFRNESDSSPAFYNSSFYSHNNHEGYAVELRYTDPYDDNENKMTAFINYVESSPIKFNAFQSDTRKVNFSISFPYDL